MEECPPGCDTCCQVFKHLPRHVLYDATSEIDGKGLFTAVPVAKGAMIVPFTGTKSIPNYGTASNGYTLEIHSKAWISPKGRHRYVNHNCQPNAEFVKWTNHRGFLMVSIVALKEIPKGAEICVNYGTHHDLSTGRLACH
jgi:SET domain-containing protein